MSAGDSLSPQQFPSFHSEDGQVRHDYLFRPTHGPAGLHEVQAWRRGHGNVGNLTWVGHGATHHEVGEVKWVGVNEEHQRRGIGSGMWAAARGFAALSGGHIPEPVHSMDRTEDGNEWAYSVSPEHKIPPEHY